MGSCTQIDTVGLETSNQDQRDLMEDGTQAVALELTWLGGREATRPGRRGRRAAVLK